MCYCNNYYGGLGCGYGYGCGYGGLRCFYGGLGCGYGCGYGRYGYGCYCPSCFGRFRSYGFY
ncbi:PREDICTED: keratin-associated protein 20-1-like [Galeopterus variegatus]|uniref:Keratin-associated protein 20-1-like n=1 Tax=Galeopterus variegatus TaxID=482537 RepID=A0ABM0SJV6_GALVR|nr:PREDICTED: keratin-associated protein 20-1-like [Galeopterus variegatus]